MVYGHLLRFGQVTLDRLFFIRKQLKGFQVTISGEEEMLSRLAQRRGALLLSAHLGSLEAMRARAGVIDVPLNFIGYFRNARAINSAARALDPESRTRVIELHPGRISSLLTVRDCIERGEFVAAAADRVGIRGETVEVDFLGSPARLPGGIYRLAASLQCPVYLTFGLYRAPNHYDIHCELFAERVVLPREGRRKAVAAYAQRFADRLAHYATQAPDNWFNFYDFWTSSHPAA
jgi:predicted LPLAT superfamily acyltransferase